MGLVKLPKMNDEEIKEVLKTNDLCRIAFIDGEYPYISPFQYVYINDCLYFHFTDYGKKKTILNKNKKVCVSIERFESDLNEYYFISIQGSLREIDDPRKKQEIINMMLENAKEKFSTNFLSVHGLEKEKGWKSMEGAESMIIYKLKEIGKRIGLKSL